MLFDVGSTVAVAGVVLINPAAAASAECIAAATGDCAGMNNEDCRCMLLTAGEAAAASAGASIGDAP